jgi:hypothetical protein
MAREWVYGVHYRFSAKPVGRDGVMIMIYERAR